MDFFEKKSGICLFKVLLKTQLSKLNSKVPDKFYQHLTSCGNKEFGSI